MATHGRSTVELLEKITILEERLNEAEQTLEAIRSGDVDALVVGRPGKEHLYILSGAEYVYRVLVESINQGALILASDDSICYCNGSFSDMVRLPVQKIVGSCLKSFVTPDSRRDITELTRKACRSGRAGGEFVLQRSDAALIPVNLSLQSVRMRDFEGVCAIVTDLSAQKQAEGELKGNRTELERLVGERTSDLAGANAELSQEIAERRRAEEALRRSESRFKLLSETASRLLVYGDARDIVNRACSQVLDHLDCQVFFNYLLDERAGKLHLNACAGIPDADREKIEWIEIEDAVCGRGDRESIDVIVCDTSTSPDSCPGTAKAFGIQVYACFPLLSEGRLIGTLSFGAKTRPHFSPEDLALLRTVVDQVTHALERIRLIKELQETRDILESRVRERTVRLENANEQLRMVPQKLIAAQENERRRIAGDLHDSIGQTLAALKFRVEHVLEILKKGNSEEGLRLLEQFIPNLQYSINETRAIYMGLAPKMLDDFGIVTTLHWYRQELLKLYPGQHIEFEVDIPKNETIPPHLNIPIYRIAQEALNNVSKHSKAEWVDLSLAVKQGAVELMIRDDGIGMDLEYILRSTMAKSLGLTGMKERAEMTGGSLHIESTQGLGTTVRAFWPPDPMRRCKTGVEVRKKSPGNRAPGDFGKRQKV